MLMCSKFIFEEGNLILATDLHGTVVK